MRIGVDLGGTKIEVIALDSADHECFRRRRPTPAAAGYDAVVGAVVDAVVDAEATLGLPPTEVGIGTPGSLGADGGRMRNANTTCLNGRRLLDDLIERLARPVRLANDADCFALSEAADGAAAGADVVFGVIAGTGVGGGLVIGGRVRPGPNAVAGEWGHNPLPWPADDERPGPLCYCGRHGCIETFLSGPGLAADHVAHGGEAVDARQVAARAVAGDALARATRDRHADRFARSLASVINVVDPDVVVLGGGVSNLPGLCTAVRERWDAYVFTDAPVRTRLVTAAHGDSSGVRGAARLWDPPPR